MLDPEIKRNFYECIDAILSQSEIYVVVACVIQKEPFIKHFSDQEDVYGLSLSYLIERSIFCVDDISENATIDIIFEKRGKVEDRTLTKFYNQLRVTGTKWVTSERLRAHISGFTSRSKKDNVIGLQVADLIAYPIARKILFPDVPNPAFDIIKNNIFTSHGAMLGLKVIPD